MIELPRADGEPFTYGARVSEDQAVRVVFGPDYLRRVAGKAKALASRILLISGRDALDPARRVSRDLGLALAGRIDEVVQHVPGDLAGEASAATRDASAHVLLAIDPVARSPTVPPRAFPGASRGPGSGRGTRPERATFGVLLTPSPAGHRMRGTAPRRPSLGVPLPPNGRLASPEGAGSTSEGVRAMIPTMILYGLALGRWWKSAIVSGMLLWAVLLVASGEMEFGWALLVGAALGAANTALGVAVHQGVLRAFRAARGLWGEVQSAMVEGSPRDSDTGSDVPSGGTPPEPGRGDGR